jgi:hypothetical protein
MPDALLDRLRGAADEQAEALAVSLEIATRLRPLVQGLQITTVHASPETAVRLLGELCQSGAAGANAARTETKESRHA